MLRPSYSELMEILNNDPDLDSEITSRYTIVIAASKRARQITNESMNNTEGIYSDKAVTLAVKEMAEGLIKVIPQRYTEERTKNLDMSGAANFRVVSLDDADVNSSFGNNFDEHFQ